jgi:hypothetical protein
MIVLNERHHNVLDNHQKYRSNNHGRSNKLLCQKQTPVILQHLVKT